MSWSIGYDSNWNRDIGYGVPAECDYPRCNAQIDRGLSYVCGSNPYGGEHGCGLYFCPEHFKHRRLNGQFVQLCPRCYQYRSPYKAKADIQEWTHHKMTDPSWAEWRKENGL